MSSNEQRHAKYKVGQTVYHINGHLGERKCVIERVSLDYHGIPFSQPIYTISWQPNGGAIVHENQLRLTSAKVEVLNEGVEEHDNK